MGRSVSGLTSSSSGSNIIIMNSKTILLFFGVLVCMAISTAMAENEEGLAENSAVERIVRMADPARRERQKRKRKNKAQKKAKSKKGRKVPLQHRPQRGNKARRNNGKR